MALYVDKCHFCAGLQFEQLLMWLVRFLMLAVLNKGVFEILFPHLNIIEGLVSLLAAEVLIASNDKMWYADYDNMTRKGNL